MKSNFHKEPSKVEKKPLTLPLFTLQQTNGHNFFILYPMNKNFPPFVSYVIPILMVYERSHDCKMAVKKINDAVNFK